MFLFTSKQLEEMAIAALVIASENIRNNILFGPDVNLKAVAERFKKTPKITFIYFEDSRLNPNSGFYYNNETKEIVINLAAIEKIYFLARALPEYFGISDEDVMIDVLLQYIPHEMTHLQQGLTRFEQVKIIKDTAGRSVISEMDVIGDGVGGRFNTAYHVPKYDNNRLEFFSKLSDIMQINIKSGLLAFPFSSENKEKVQRGYSLVMMTRRIAIEIKSGQLNPFAVYAVYFNFDLESGETSTFEIEMSGGRKLLKTKFLGHEALKRLSHAVATGDMTIIMALLNQESFT